MVYLLLNVLADDVLDNLLDLNVMCLGLHLLQILLLVLSAIVVDE